MLWRDHVDQVLKQYAVPSGYSCQVVSSSGFSGARLWRVTTAAEDYCLRRWPPTTRRERLAAIVAVLSSGRLHALPPRPLPCQVPGSNVFDGERPGIVSHAGHLWTLEPWLPGQPLAKIPRSRLIVKNVLQALALFHSGVAHVDRGSAAHLEFGLAGYGAPPGVQKRTQLAENYLQRGAAALAQAAIRPEVSALRPYRERLLPLFFEVAPRLLEQVRPALQWQVPLQICIRDIHAEHVLIVGDEVSGLIDFDAMQVDCVATDLARLLGDYVRDDRELWEVGLNAYHDVRPLSPPERGLVEHYDRLAVLLTGMQWLDWILLEGKAFELSRVLPRLDATLQRLEHLRDEQRTSTRLVW